MTSFNISTAFTPRQSLPWKLNTTPNSHSWTHSSRGIVTTPFPSESAGNLHTQTNTLNSYLIIRPEQRKASSRHYSTEQRTSLATLPTKKKKEVISQQYFKLMVTQRNSSTTQLEHHSYQDNQQIMTIPKIKNK